MAGKNRIRAINNLWFEMENSPRTFTKPIGLFLATFLTTFLTTFLAAFLATFLAESRRFGHGLLEPPWHGLVI